MELEQLKARYERLALLHHVSQVIHSSLDPLEALDLIVSEAVRVTQASSGSVVLLNPTTRKLEIAASSGLPIGSDRFELRLGEGITGWVAQHGVAARVNDVSKDPRYIPLRTPAQSELAVPFEINGELAGVVNVDPTRRTRSPRTTKASSRSWPAKRPLPFIEPGCTNSCASRPACSSRSSRSGRPSTPHST